LFLAFEAFFLPESCSDVNKDLGPKAKGKDRGHVAKAETFGYQGQGQRLGSQIQGLEMSRLIAKKQN